jgi:glycosyltransferase involved in cell wall biosynthesis
VSDLHVYLTVPFVLSWSLFNALASGAVVLASDTAPVRELVTHERTGLLVPFFDVDQFVATANRVLDNPIHFRPLGHAAADLIRSRYSLDVVFPQFMTLCETARRNRSAG